MQSKQRITHNFNQVANNYDKVATLQYAVGHKLINYLNSVKIQPQRILDIGAGTGYFAKLLTHHYSNSKIIIIDIAQNMLSIARSSLQEKENLLCADFDHLPLIDQSVDLIFANMSLQWSLDLNKTILELNRVLKSKGVLIFSTLGPGTLHELQNSWSQIDNNIHVNSFLSAKELQNILQNKKFTVHIYTEKIIQTYSTVHQLMHNLKSIGANYINSEKKSKNLMTERKLKQLESAYEKYHTATYEIIYVIAHLEDIL